MIPYIWKLPAVNGKVPPGGMRYASSKEITNEDGVIDWQALRESVYYQCQLCEGTHGLETQRTKTGATRADVISR